MDLYFSQAFEVPGATVDAYGAFDISVVSDLPVFVDPFRLFNSNTPEYQALHDDILKYLFYLRDQAGEQLDDATIRNLYAFPEVKQSWLGYTFFGNDGRGLGPAFARALYESLGTILQGFGTEQISQSSHLEKLTLIHPGVGRDNISDFATNLIKHYLLDYTEQFARAHLKPEHCRDVAVTRAWFNYQTHSWATKTYYLPYRNGDYVLLTPMNLLTRDETWINHADMLRQFSLLPEALPDSQLRAQVNLYFQRKLPSRANAKERTQAAQATILEFPQLIDHYIRLKEDAKDEAASLSDTLVRALQRMLVEQVKEVVPDLQAKTAFYEKPWTSYDECLARALDFKDYVENKDGYRVINRAGIRSAREPEVQLFFGLIWCKSEFDVNREVNNGRGPVDFKVSFGSHDKSLIEFKLGSNTQLQRNLEKQVAVYEAANGTRRSIKVIVNYTVHDETRVRRILKLLGIENEESVIVVDARNDNKPSGSRA